MKKLKHKELCKLVKHDALDSSLEAYKELVRNPTHICTDCGRVSNDPGRLCEPEPLGGDFPGTN